MIENKSTDLKVERVEGTDRFQITFTKIDEMDAEDVVKNIEGLAGAIEKDEEALGTLDMRIAKEKLAAEKNLETNRRVYAPLKEVEAVAKLLKRQHELKDDRTSKGNEGNESN